MRAFLAVIAGLALLVGSGEAVACDRSPVLVRDALLWSPEGTQARDVLFADGKVARIAAPGRIRAVGNMRVIDGRGQTLLPGFIDLHLHFVLPGGVPQGVSRTREMKVAGQQALASGVTSGRVHLASLTEGAWLKAEGSKPCAAMPRVQVGGPGMGGGTPDLNGSQFRGVRSAADAAAKVAEVKAAGLDWIAVHYASRFLPGELEAIAAAARGAGLRIMTGADNPADLEAFLAIRPDTLDYIDRTEAAAYPAALVARAREAGIAWVPIVGYSHRARGYREDPARVELPSHFAFMTDAEKAHAIGAARAVLARPDGLEFPLRAWPHLAGKLNQLLASGAPMAIGSDVGSNAHFQMGGFWWELEGWRAAGVVPDEVLRAATIIGAGVLKEPSWGTIRAGAEADFLLYKGRIGEGPFDMGRLTTVAKSGVIFVQDGRWVGPEGEGSE